MNDYGGFENNCTRVLSIKNPLQIVAVKGLGSGTGSLLLTRSAGEAFISVPCLAAALILGFIAYGLSISCYVYEQRVLGAARTSTYYAISPFLAAILSLLIFRETPDMIFWLALLIMLAGTYFAREIKEEG